MTLYAPENEHTLSHQSRNTDLYMASEIYNPSGDMKKSNKQEEFHLHAGCVSVLDLLEAVGDTNFAESWHERQRQLKMKVQTSEEKESEKDETFEMSGINKDDSANARTRKTSISSVSTTQSSDLESDEEVAVEEADISEESALVLPYNKVRAHNAKRNEKPLNGFVDARVPEAKVMKLNQKGEDWLEKFSSVFPQLELDLDDLRDKFEGKEELLGSYLYSKVRHS